MDSLSKRNAFWTAVRESVAGTEQDFTEGSLGRAITLLAIPMVLEMSMESLFAIVDVFWVSRLGKDAVAAVGLTESLMTIVYTVALGISMETTAIVARRIGEKDPEEASATAVQSIGLGVVVSAVVGVAGVLLSRRLLAWMGAAPAVVETGAGYTAWILGSSVTVLLLFLINAVFRGAGDAVVAMRALWLGNGVNILLDPCFIFGWGPFPEMGVTGAAVATAIGRGVGVCYQVWVLTQHGGRVRVGKAHLRFARDVLKRLLRLSLTGMLKFLVATASWIGLVRIIALSGSSALAGYTIALRIIVFAILPAWGMSNAVATLVGQNLGAAKPQRAERAVWVTGFYNMIFLAGVTVVFLVFAEPLVRLFTRDPGVIPYAADCLRLVSYGYVFYAYGMVMVQAFNGAGDTTTPTIINLFCYWLWQIPLAYALAVPLGLGAQGVFWAITVAESTIAVVGMLAFRRGRWKAVKV